MRRDHLLLTALSLAQAHGEIFNLHFTPDHTLYMKLSIDVKGKKAVSNVHIRTPVGSAAEQKEQDAEMVVATFNAYKTHAECVEESLEVKFPTPKVIVPRMKLMGDGSRRNDDEDPEDPMELEGDEDDQPAASKKRGKGKKRKDVEASGAENPARPKKQNPRRRAGIKKTNAAVDQSNMNSDPRSFPGQGSIPFSMNTAVHPQFGPFVSGSMSAVPTLPPFTTSMAGSNPLAGPISGHLTPPEYQSAPRSSLGPNRPGPCFQTNKAIQCIPVDSLVIEWAMPIPLYRMTRMFSHLLPIQILRSVRSTLWTQTPVRAIIAPIDLHLQEYFR
uniref:AlNc14C233G9329 protein n=1 Tax=Albugo laibachii Nc14 TaxID=890382 RepID=F0WSI6_9STRA|nr:AlNc14C233G9329 [Albugo laibachii Nc14]|eukprot:CCA24310.1 AlNc14C233G9329 [Albugo laibachii Nc14]